MTTGSALAWTIQPTDFLDFERAKRYWTTVRTQEQWDATNEPCTHNDYLDWKRRLARDPAGTVATLKDTPKADEYQACYDFDLTYEKWRQIYHSWLATLHPRPWNQTTSKFDCNVIQTLNIFTGQCNDLPDWRTVDDRARDAKRLADDEAARPGKGK